MKTPRHCRNGGRSAERLPDIGSVIKQQGKQRVAFAMSRDGRRRPFFISWGILSPTRTTKTSTISALPVQGSAAGAGSYWAAASTTSVVFLTQCLIFKEVSGYHRLGPALDVFPALIQAKPLLRGQDLAQIFQDQSPLRLSKVKPLG